MNRDEVINYLAGLSDRDIASLIGDAGQRGRARQPEAAPTAGELLDSLDQIRDSLTQVEEQIQAATQSGDHVTSIALKRGPQLSLRQDAIRKQQQLNSILDEGK